jgi:hypothetical protein
MENNITNVTDASSKFKRIGETPTKSPRRDPNILKLHIDKKPDIKVIKGSGEAKNNKELVRTAYEQVQEDLNKILRLGTNEILVHVREGIVMDGLRSLYGIDNTLFDQFYRNSKEGDLSIEGEARDSILKIESQIRELISAPISIKNAQMFLEYFQRKFPKELPDNLLQIVLSRKDFHIVSNILFSLSDYTHTPGEKPNGFLDRVHDIIYDFLVEQAMQDALDNMEI